MEQFPEAQWFLSMTTYMTWSDEDFIGRISRISRRTSPQTASERTISRSLGLYKRQWTRAFGNEYASGWGPRSLMVRGTCAGWAHKMRCWMWAKMERVIRAVFYNSGGNHTFDIEIDYSGVIHHDTEICVSMDVSGIYILCIICAYIHYIDFCIYAIVHGCILYL